MGYRDRIFPVVTRGLVLAHFTYRFYRWFATGSLLDREEPRWFQGMAMILHCCFERSDPYGKIFAWRSVAIMMLIGLYEHTQMKLFVYSRAIVVFAAMFGADLVTEYNRRIDMHSHSLHSPHSSPSVHAMNQPYPHFVPRWFIDAHGLFYSTSMILGTLSMLYMGRDLVFLSLVPIQTAPVAMALVKRGFLSHAGWHLWYTTAILINYAYAFALSHGQDAQDAHLTVEFTHMRRLAMMVLLGGYVLRMNKYVLWGAIIAAFSVQKSIS